VERKKWEQPPSGSASSVRAVPTSRIDVFSDGVTAVAITPLVLEVKIPARGGAGLSHALLEQWPA
jgi:uncharacterized membrane protein